MKENGPASVYTLALTTGRNREMIDITRDIQAFIQREKLSSGMVMVWCPHTTAALTVNECADPDVARDILNFLEKSVPSTAHFRHAEGNSPAHIMASLFSVQLLLMVSAGDLLLGRWQGVFFCEFDGPRKRQLHMRVAVRDEGG